MKVSACIFLAASTLGPVLALPAHTSAGHDGRRTGANISHELPLAGPIWYTTAQVPMSLGKPDEGIATATVTVPAMQHIVTKVHTRVGKRDEDTTTSTVMSPAAEHTLAETSTGLGQQDQGVTIVTVVPISSEGGVTTTTTTIHPPSTTKQWSPTVSPAVECRHQGTLHGVGQNIRIRGAHFDPSKLPNLQNELARCGHLWWYKMKPMNYEYTHWEWEARTQIGPHHNLLSNCMEHAILRAGGLDTRCKKVSILRGSI